MAEVMKSPTKIVLLQVCTYLTGSIILEEEFVQNMVGPGEVDDDLEPETAEECTKYGEVEKCVIFEVNCQYIM